MAEPVSLAEAREQVRLDAGDTSEDAWLSGLIIAARRSVETRTNRTIVGDAPTLTGDDVAVAKQAILLLVGHWFANREGSSTEAGSAPVELPLSVSWLLQPITAWPVD